MRSRPLKTKWYCRFSEAQEGPFSSRQMRALAKEGRITAKTPVRREADERWYSASKVRGLFRRKKSKRDPATEEGKVSANAEQPPAAVGEIVKAQLAESVVTGGPPAVVVPPVAANAAPAGVLEGLALAVPPRARVTPAARKERKAEMQVWIAGGLAACVVVLATLSGVLAYRLAQGTTEETPAATAPLPAKQNQAAPTAVAAADASALPGGPTPASAPAVVKAPEGKAAGGNALVSSQKKWTPLVEMGDGVVSEGIAIQVTRLWWAGDAAGKQADGTKPASYLFMELQLTNLEGVPRKYKSWNSTDRDFAIAVDQLNRAMSLIVRAETKEVTRLTEVEVKPGESVKDVLVFAAPASPPEMLRIMLNKKAISGESGFVAWEIGKEIWDVATTVLPVEQVGKSAPVAAPNAADIEHTVARKLVEQSAERKKRLDDLSGKERAEIPPLEEAVRETSQEIRDYQQKYDRARAQLTGPVSDKMGRPLESSGIPQGTRVNPGPLNSREIQGIESKGRERAANLSSQLDREYEQKMRELRGKHEQAESKLEAKQLEFERLRQQILMGS